MRGSTKAVLCLAVALAVSDAPPLQAHTHLLRATPADGSSIGVSPPRLQLEFSEAATVTGLSIQRTGDAAPLKLTRLRQRPSAGFVIDLPLLAPGNYLVKWRALSDDSHVASGSIRFTLQAR